jgi:hypothetical protein
MHFNEKPKWGNGREEQRLQRAVLDCRKRMSDIGFALFGGSWKQRFALLWYGHATSNLKRSLGKGDPRLEF